MAVKTIDGTFAMVEEQRFWEAWNQLFDVSQDEVTTLDGHLGEVFVCAWNPKKRSVSQRQRNDGENLDVTG